MMQAEVSLAAMLSCLLLIALFEACSMTAVSTTGTPMSCTF